MSGAPIVLKFGGELIEDRAALQTVVSTIAAFTAVAPTTPLVVVHGGGREIDAALKTAGIEKRQIEGLRITDEPTLDVVVGVLAGTVNTRFVAALGARGVSAIGMTGADDRCGLSDVAPPHITVDGRDVDLGRVGIPAADSGTRLLRMLTDGGYVPIIACIGVTENGDLLNVNADTLAGHLAARLSARRLVIAGGTAGVLDAVGATIAELDADSIAALVSGGTATAGMIAKLRACEHALAGGVEEVLIVDGKSGDALAAALRGEASARSTRLAPGLRHART